MSTYLQPLVSERRSDGVVERLRTLILTGAYPPGSRLPNERELSEKLAVNRGSVREALKRLEFLELIDVRHGQGSFVRDIASSSALHSRRGAGRAEPHARGHRSWSRPDRTRRARGP